MIILSIILFNILFQVIDLIIFYQIIENNQKLVWVKKKKANEINLKVKILNLSLTLSLRVLKVILKSRRKRM